MPQLRCAQTSELLAEGTPLEIATVAEAFAAGEVLFDDVGGVDRNGVSTFDPAAVRKARADELAVLESTLAAMPTKAPKDEDPDAYKQRRAATQATIAERRDRIAAGKAMQLGARNAMQTARDRVEKRKADDAKRR
jgi:hypothetical protein